MSLIEGKRSVYLWVDGETWWLTARMEGTVDDMPCRSFEACNLEETLPHWLTYWPQEVPGVWTVGTDTRTAYLSVHDAIHGTLKVRRKGQP